MRFHLLRHNKWASFVLLGLALVALVAARPPAAGARLTILISIEQKYLWLVYGTDVIFEAPVAVGVSEDFEYRGRKYNFDTPRGRRTILGKEADPVWTVPEWHYYEKATHKQLEVVHIRRGERYDLGDSTHITVQNDQVGRVNRFGNFWPFTPGNEIIYYGKLYVPPLDTPQRRVPAALGPFKLDMGAGYLIHGTNLYNEDSIGLPASHGCVRMHNSDLVRLYELVEVGTPVFID
ncbi:MAG: L,D-transpeptidase [Gemmatimonadota bacterium]